MSENTNADDRENVIWKSGIFVFYAHLIIVLCLGFSVTENKGRITDRIGSCNYLSWLHLAFKLDTVLLWYADGCRGRRCFLILMSRRVIGSHWHPSCSD